MALKMDPVSWWLSSRRRNFNSIVASGADSRDRSMPTKRRMDWLSYRASSMPSSDNLASVVPFSPCKNRIAHMHANGRGIYQRFLRLCLN